ncbi:RNA-binding (RRM/RBD/RNP motifs) family protein [Rhynchospora pubera]|uniref:RNA-binding (RRM/RBD/RNP motifs) family protein n=2 Tax=Rhynchospora pubera TaxID=906938 RepID=A0AAV8G884_9POAL|nr:RNA-binding (RRM/RBD/RNP motifs) family protein [Rhynchospora pubera]KAJ4799920.1 RNA-binding (RRM/RBD/RNP motifs) family protein [Rhynchospora pubera]
MTVTTVKVSNVSLQASKQDLKEFFSFSGDILYVEMQKENDLSQIAYITFKDTQGAETAMLLTGATIVDMSVVVMPATDYEVPAEVLAAQREAAAEVKPLTTGPQSALQRAEDMVSSMLAKGFVLGKDALEKAKTLDEKHQITSTASAKVTSLDRKIGLTEKMKEMDLKVKEMDQKYQVTEKTRTTFAAAEQTLSNAGSAFMKNRYVITSAAWVTEAFNKAKERLNAEPGQGQAQPETESKQAEDGLTPVSPSETREATLTPPTPPPEEVEKCNKEIVTEPVEEPVKEKSTDPEPPKKPEPAQGLVL